VRAPAIAALALCGCVSLGPTPPPSETKWADALNLCAHAGFAPGSAELNQCAAQVVGNNLNQQQPQSGATAWQVLGAGLGGAAAAMAAQPAPQAPAMAHPVECRAFYGRVVCQ
jgi:hypothetical protein